VSCTARRRADEHRQNAQVCLFNFIDDFNREALAMDIDFSLPAERVVRTRNQVIKLRGKP